MHDQTTPTQAEVLSQLREELAICRRIAFYPDAYAGDFEQFYVDFHALSRKLITDCVTADDAPAVSALRCRREALTRIADDSASTVWEIWGEHMACDQPVPVVAWDCAYDNPDFRPFLNPYLASDQRTVKGNIIVIAGGGSTHRANHVEGYPVAAFFRDHGYNAFVLQRRVMPYAEEAQWLDLARAVRFLRHNASQLRLAKPEIVMACGFSAGGMNIMSVIARQFGHVTPDAVDPRYVCDAVDAESADLTVALPIYGVRDQGLDFTQNSHIPPIFSVVGQRDELFAAGIPDAIALLLGLGTDVSFWVAPDANHGFGLATGVRRYTNRFAAAEVWPEMALRFIETRLGLTDKVVYLRT